jgi:hypothetical protein
MNFHRLSLLSLLAVAGLCFASCATKPPIRRPTDSAVVRRYDLENWSLAAVFEVLGKKTTYDRTAFASELSGEFYTPVNARYALDDPASRDVRVREVRWGDGDQNIAVFCVIRNHKWEVFHAVEWDKARRF